MGPQKDPVVIDLASRRRSKRLEEAARAKAARAAGKRTGEPLLGPRPNAAFILALIAAVLLLAWLVPKLF